MPSRDVRLELDPQVRLPAVDWWCRQRYRHYLAGCRGCADHLQRCGYHAATVKIQESSLLAPVTRTLRTRT
jgi:hypothetical protein